MAIGISKSPEGAQLLRNLSTSLLAQLEVVNTATDSLQRSYESLKKDLAHETEIEEILQGIRTIQTNTSVPVANLSRNLNSLATALEAFLNGGLGGSGN